ncbi:unnamed protein product [Gongylonema pulchrum]|uniref:LIM zinc-binding domain-containing protein n=1 Tax=Gongylonema pulchrum TaxID=637853 RepID=A0A183DJC7_9BILA|nr:unnamed protein product [Gongylonema pulchrum]
MDSVASTDSGVSMQRKKYEEITSSLEKQLNLNRKQVGICALCEKAIVEEADVTYALGQVYHQKCFVCDICGRTLRGKKFYKVRVYNFEAKTSAYGHFHEGRNMTMKQQLYLVHTLISCSLLRCSPTDNFSNCFDQCRIVQWSAC